jgi:hypothetical protein
MHCIAAQFVPRLLTDDQNQWSINVCLELWENGNEDPTFMSISRIITGDESWIYGYDPETKQNRHSGRAHNHQEKKKAHQVRRPTKSMHIFFDVKGIVTVNLFLLTLRSTLTFWDAWEKMCDKKDQNFGATTTGSFITTMHLPTCPWKPQSVWLTTTWLSFPIHPTRQT